MPFGELLIKKIYTKFAGELKPDLNLSVRETNTNTCLFNFNRPFRNSTILDDITQNKNKIHLYSKVNQTPQNASLYKTLIKNGYNRSNDFNVKDLDSGKDSYRIKDKFYDNYDINDLKLNDSFGGVWSLFYNKDEFY